MRQLFNYKIAILCGISLLATGCRKELTYEPEEIVPGYRMDLDVDWTLEWESSNGFDWSSSWSGDLFDEDYEHYRPKKPEGFGVVLYDMDDDEYAYNREIHLPSDGGKLSVDETTRALLFYSDDSDYITLSDIGAPHTAYASTNTRARSSFDELHSGERTVNPPDILYGAYMEVNDLQYQEGYQQQKVSFQPLVYGYVIRFAIDSNREYVALARGALAGMAEGIYLKDARTSGKAVTLLFDCDVKSYGVGTQVMTFGIPNHALDDGNKVDASRRYDVSLEIMLKNGKTLNYEFDVTDQVNRQPRGGVILLQDITIPDDVAKEPNSGFNPDVEDWGEMTDVYL